MLKKVSMRTIGIEALTLFARPAMRLLLFALTLCIGGYLVFVFAYIPLTGDAQLPGVIAAQQAKVDTDALQGILSASEERAQGVQKSFASAPSIFAHAISE